MTTPTTDTWMAEQRRLFEEWCRDVGADDALWHQHAPEAGYRNSRTADYWTGWLAHARLRVQGDAALLALSLFHVAWAAAKEAPGYDKKAWIRVQQHFESALASRQLHTEGGFADDATEEAWQAWNAAIQLFAAPAPQEAMEGRQAVAWMHEYTSPHDGSRRLEPRRRRPSDDELLAGDTVRALVYASPAAAPIAQAVRMLTEHEVQKLCIRESIDGDDAEQVADLAIQEFCEKNGLSIGSAPGAMGEEQ